jgi:hypothetical protein
MSALKSLQNHLKPGHLYRRSDLEKHSNAVDRHLKQLQTKGVLKKLSGGLYHYPRMTKFGEAPPADKELVRSFLKDNRFLLFSPNAYNSLGLGTTQLYNETVVYNHKRHGIFKVGGRTFRFIRKNHFPPTLSKEFLLIDLVNKEKHLQESSEVFEKAKALAKKLNQQKLKALLIELDWKHAKLVLSDIPVQHDEKLHMHLPHATYQFVSSGPKSYKDISFG